MYSDDVVELESSVQRTVACLMGAEYVYNGLSGTPRYAACTWKTLGISHIYDRSSVYALATISSPSPRNQKPAYSVS